MTIHEVHLKFEDKKCFQQCYYQYMFVWCILFFSLLIVNSLITPDKFVLCFYFFLIVRCSLLQYLESNSKTIFLSSEGEIVQFFLWYLFDNLYLFLPLLHTSVRISIDGVDRRHQSCCCILTFKNRCPFRTLSYYLPLLF